MSEFFAGVGGTGVQGPQGATGPFGPGVSGIYYSNNGATVGLFQNVNLLGGFLGTTGAGNTANINSLNDFGVFGLTGNNLGASGAGASGAMVQWNTNIVAPTGVAIGHTTIATQAGWITINKAGWYEVDYSLAFTGIGSGINQIQAQCYLGATGGNRGGGFGSGTAVPQSLALASIASGVGRLSQSFIVSIPSGYSIETYVNNLAGANPSGISYSPTGSQFTIRTTG